MPIAFLRGINVGGHNVRKDVLRQVFLGLDLTGAETFIASGNVLFDDTGGDAEADLEDRIATALEKVLGWPVATFVRSAAEVAAIVAVADRRAELTPGEGETLQVGLLRRPPAAAAGAALEQLSTPADLLRVDGRELYWLSRGSVGRSKVTNARLERVGGGPVTFRNLTTMRRLVDVLAT